MTYRNQLSNRYEPSDRWFAAVASSTTRRATYGFTIAHDAASAGLLIEFERLAWLEDVLKGGNPERYLERALDPVAV